MKLVIAAVSSNRSLSGVSRHAANVAKCLLLRPELSALHVLVAPWEEGHLRDAIFRNDPRLRIHPVPLGPGTLERNLWYYRTLPGIADQLRADIVHLAYPSPIAATRFACPTVVTLHDLYPYDIPSNFGFPRVLFNRMILRQCLGNASAIACVSQATRERLGELMPLALPKSVTISNCAEIGPPPRKPIFAAGWTDQPFVLCVAQHRRNKNVLFALRVFQSALRSGRIASNVRFLVVGLSGPESARIYRFVRTANLEQAVVFVDGISDAELGWCYRNCELLLAPSLIEGFGLPVLEAQLAGCRVVCSDIPAFREVGSNACRFVSLRLGAEEDFADVIADVLRKRRPAAAALPQLSPSAIAEQYMALYRALFTCRGAEVPGREFSQRQPTQEIAESTPALPRGVSSIVRL